MKKSAVLESASLGVTVAPVVIGGPAAPNAACHSDENSLLDDADGVSRISFNNVMSSLSTSKSDDSRSTAPGSTPHHSIHRQEDPRLLDQHHIIQSTGKKIHPSWINTTSFNPPARPMLFISAAGESHQRK